MLIRIVVLLALVLSSPVTRADYMVGYLRVSCVPEARYVGVEYHPLHSGMVEHYVELFDKQGLRTDVWKRQGFYRLSSLDIKCKLPEATYRIVTKQGPWHLGECGSAPSTSLWIYRDKELIVRDVFIGILCRHGPTVTRIDINDGKSRPDSPGAGRSMLVYFSSKGDIELRGHEFISFSGSIAGNVVIPIDQRAVDAYVSAANNSLQRP
jgi:hypothetical protein